MAFPFPPVPLPRFLPSELKAANQRLTASGREDRASSRPRAAAAAAHAAKELEELQRAAATLRQQVQHQSEIIDSLREDVRDRVTHEHDDGAQAALAAAAAAAGVSEAVKEAEAAAEAAQDEAEDLRDRLAEAERELQRMERRIAMSGGRAGKVADASEGGGGPGTSEAGLARSEGAVDHEKALQLERENRRLREENDKLSTELQAFDLEFFEEIEDLKYKYSEATKKLRRYEE